MLDTTPITIEITRLISTGPLPPASSPALSMTLNVRPVRLS
jgi:hypothetical protein